MTETKAQQALRALDGVISVHFDADVHPHAVVVAYNTEAVSSDVLLETIRECDPRAVKVVFNGGESRCQNDIAAHLTRIPRRACSAWRNNQVGRS